MVRYAIEPYPSLVFGFGGRVNSAVREWVGLDRASAGHTAPWSPNVALARLSISFECLYPVCDWREWNERGMNLVGVALFLCIAHRGRRAPRCPLLYQGFQWHHRSGAHSFA